MTHQISPIRLIFDKRMVCLKTKNLAEQLVCEVFDFLILTCDPAGTRTQDPYIKSVLLYRLSYEILKTYFLPVLKAFP